MDTVNADVHQGSVGKCRMESVFDDPLFEMVIAAGIFTERKIYLPDCSKHRQQGTDRCKTGRKDRTHGFEQNDLIFYGSVVHLLKFRSIGGDRLFTEHMLVVLHHQDALGSMAEIGAGDVDCVDLVGVGQRLQRIKDKRNVIFLCILPRPRKRSGIDSAELEIRQCRGCLEKFIGNGVCADYSETDHVEALLYYQVLSV